MLLHHTQISLLAKLAFGQNVPIRNVSTEGITKISADDFKTAASMRSTIKLLGYAAKNDCGTLVVYVSPVLVPLSHPLASVRESQNMVAVKSKNLGLTSFAGGGAGRYPTANSVVNDIVRIARDKCGEPFPLDISLDFQNDYDAKFYVACESEVVTTRSRLLSEVRIIMKQPC